MFRRLTFKATMNSTGRGWWDPNTETYDFSIYETPVKAIAEMYQNGWMLGADDLGIDEIRAQFAAGRVGMFPGSVLRLRRVHLSVPGGVQLDRHRHAHL